VRSLGRDASNAGPPPPLGLNRRQFLGASLTAAGSGLPTPGLLKKRPPAGPAKARLILLGTGGGPRPRTTRRATSQVIVANDQLFVVDCGDGVATQLAAAHLSLDKLRHVFITHHHSDHNADYGNLLLFAWSVGLKTTVDTWGPAPLDRITKLFLEMSAVDVDTRIADEGRPPLVPLVHSHELRESGPVTKEGAVKVSCARVDHPMIKDAFAYRFDTPDRSFVISGDTARSDALVALARGADVLVHEAIYVPAIERIAARVPNATTLRKHLLESHTPAEECGKIAAAAGVKTLVLSHLVPADDPAVTDDMWIEAARRHFDGRIVVATDLLEV
jgi:ribonuclease BN (tRNA processing enzyme)